MPKFLLPALLDNSRVIKGYMLKVDCNSLRDICSCLDHVTSFFSPGQLRVGLGSGEEFFFPAKYPYTKLERLTPSSKVTWGSSVRDNFCS